jgi:hypothetical protein
MRRFLSAIINLYFRYAFVRQIIWSIFVLAVFSIVAALVFQNTSVSTNPVGWERSFQVSSFNVVAKNVNVAYLGDVIVVSYEGRAAGRQGVYVSISFDGGVTFMPPVKVADADSKIPLNPHAAVSPSGIITVAWQAYIDSESTNRIFCATSKDYGATWSPPAKILLKHEMEMLPRAYYDDRNVLHLFFHGSEGDNINLFHAESEDGVVFKTTGSLMRLTSSMRGAFFPSIVVSGKQFYMVWQGKEEDFSDQLFFMKSSNYGWSWSFKKRITSSPGNNTGPAMMIHDNTLYVVYQNNAEKNWAIKMIRGVDRGWSWDDKPMTVSATMANCYSPSVGSAGDDVMVLWYDTRAGGSRIYGRKFSPREKAFQQEAEISEARYGSRNPDVVSMGRRCIVFWEERNVIMAKQTDSYVEAPVVFSETNPEGKWSRLPYAVIQWRSPRDESGIIGYATLLNEIPDFNPTVVNMKPNVTEERIAENLSDGVFYYHIRAVDGAQNYSRTIHYKLQLALNPLPGPVVVSPTHPQGKPTESGSPSFTWTVDEMERVKGFVYVLSYNTIKMPDTFTTNPAIQFDNLDMGNYFFSVAAVDKTNQLSRVTTYDFIIGSPDQEMNADHYRRLAEQEKEFMKKHPIKRQEAPGPVTGLPSVVIRFPFDTKKIFDKSGFKAIIQTGNIAPGAIVGYSVYMDDEQRDVPGRVNHTGATLEVNGLSDGEYYIGVKCKYAGVVNGARRYYWTGPFEAKISVQLPAERSPVVQYARTIMEKFPRRFTFITLTFAGLGLVITTMGFGPRISFYLQLALFRLLLLLRLARKRE